MFEQKLTSLFSAKENNQFVKQALKASNTTLSANGATKYTTTGNPFVDQFA